ncbi:TfoX/Sxy family protein [Paeniglutamicibacter antarcticus]|uniref:TfoX/Sxy family protein n=2 Tax=Paeniglutamicibacter antarcticus TaxID=494023 RepID=A0ABP9TSG2_9MICC
MHRVRDAMASLPNVREVRMFGGLSFMVDARLSVSASIDGNLLVRIAPADYDELCQRGGKPAYMGKGRPMGPGWLTVPFEHLQDDGELAYWINVGIDSRDA